MNEQQYKKFEKEYIEGIIPKDPKRLERIVNGRKFFFEPNLSTAEIRLEPPKEYNPLIGTTSSKWLHPDDFPNYEEAYSLIKKFWKSEVIYVNEKNHFGLITRNYVKRYKRNTCEEDYSDIHPFVKYIIDHKEEFIYDVEYMLKYYKWKNTWRERMSEREFISKLKNGNPERFEDTLS